MISQLILTLSFHIRLITTPDKNQITKILTNMSDIQIFGDSIVTGLKGFCAESGQMVSVHGFSGYTIERLIKKLTTVKTKNFDIIVMIGTNNVFKRKIDDNLRPDENDFVETGNLISKFLKLLSFLSRNFKNNTCYVMPILPRGSSVTNERVVLINSQIKTAFTKFCDSNVKFGDISYADFIGDEFSVKPELFRPDKLHPNDKGFKILQNWWKIL